MGTTDRQTTTDTGTSTLLEASLWDGLIKKIFPPKFLVLKGFFLSASLPGNGGFELGILGKLGKLGKLGNLGNFGNFGELWELGKI